MNTTARSVPRDAYTAVQGREILGIVLHHTAGTSVPTCRRGASWQYVIRQDGHVYADVEERYAAHHVAQADRWRPPWLRPAPPNAGVSDVNVWTIGVELVYAPQDGQVPTAAQHAALRELLLDLEARYGRLPVVGHGQLQRDRWETEPHGLDWWRVGLVQLAGSWWLEPIAPEPVPQPPETEPGDDMTLEERLLLDAVGRIGDIRTAEDLDQYAGRYRQMATDIVSLRELLATAQAERDAAASSAEQCQQAVDDLRSQVERLTAQATDDAQTQADLQACRAELAACQAAAQTMPGVTHITLEGAVYLADGTRVLVPVRS